MQYWEFVNIISCSILKSILFKEEAVYLMGSVDFLCLGVAIGGDATRPLPGVGSFCGQTCCDELGGCTGANRVRARPARRAANQLLAGANRNGCGLKPRLSDTVRES